MTYQAGTYDVAVIGAGHAGIEAALASARLGCQTVVFTINMDAVGNCPCNPSIGGTAKGHLVREIDALGGEMGRTADATFLQSRMLNKGKGPAVHSLRAQIDQIEQAAESELSALDREQEAIEAAYADRMEEAALRAEAEKLILSQSQDELLSLLEQYAPDYDALGQTLGEKLLDGFARGAGDVAAWFEDFSARLAGAQAQMAALAQSAADTFYDGRQTAQAAQSPATPAVTVNQTVEFNQPVETPAQVARRMEEVNEALAMML